MNPDSHILLFLYLALHHPFHLARYMLTAGLGPGLTNRSQISASHLPRGASLELILASAGPEWCLRMQDFITYICMGVLAHVNIHSRKNCAAHQSSYATRVSEDTSTSFVSLQSNSQSVECQNNFVRQNNQWC